VSDSLGFSIDGRLLKLRLEGRYSMADFIELVNRALEWPGLPQKVALMIDRRGSAVTVNSPEELQQGLEALFAWKQKILCMAYVTLSEFHFEFMQKASRFSAFNAGPPVRPFRDIEEAERWLREQEAGDRMADVP
jgi:hypothetical protein